jgi:hypothetical protein
VLRPANVWIQRLRRLLEDTSPAVRVLKKDGYWIGLPIDAPGSMVGDSLADRFEDVEASKHFCLGLPKEVQVAVAYTYDLPEFDEAVIDVYRDLRTRRDTIVRQLDEAARTAVARLKQAGLSVRDSAALLGLSPSRVDQLRRGS